MDKNKSEQYTTILQEMIINTCLMKAITREELAEKNGFHKRSLRRYDKITNDNNKFLHSLEFLTKLAEMNGYDLLSFIEALEQKRANLSQRDSKTLDIVKSLPINLLEKILDLIKSNSSNIFKFELILYIMDNMNKLENNKFKELIEKIDFFSKGFFDRKKLNKLIKNIFY